MSPTLAARVKNLEKIDEIEQQSLAERKRSMTEVGFMRLQERREKIAVELHAGILANPHNDRAKPHDAARRAIRHADALIAELEKDETP